MKKFHCYYLLQYLFQIVAKVLKQELVFTKQDSLRAVLLKKEHGGT
jgi:hypothetical protein